MSATGIRTSDVPFLLADALQRAGHDVVLLPLDSGLDRAAETAFALGGFDEPVYRALFQRHTRRVADRVGPDVVLIYGSNWTLEPETIGYLRRGLGAQVVLWEVNQRIFQGRQAACMPLYDHVFCLDSYYVPMLRAGGLRCVEHLCAAADPEEHSAIALSADDRDLYEADVSFIGTYHPERAALLATLAGTGVKVRIYGHGWAMAGSPVDEWTRVEPVYGRKKTLVYSASRMSCHLRGRHMINGENFRVFEVSACGRATLCRVNPDLEHCFDIQSELLIFDDGADLRGAVERAMADPAALTARSEAARARVLAHHTYDHRAAVILDHVMSERCVAATGR